MKTIHVIFFLALTGAAQASPFPNGNAETGKRLVVETKCEACHARKAGGDGTSLYTRPERKVTSASKLAAQVAFCNNALNAGLFPDDEEHISAFLNKAYYKFRE